MESLIFEWIGFVGKAVILVIGFAAIIGIATASRSGKGKKFEGELKVRSLNQFYKKLHRAVEGILLSKAELKAMKKAEAKTTKKVKKEGLASTNRQKVFVIDFKGDLRATGVESLRHEVTAVLGHAKATDEIVVKLESPGGSVDGYGLAASQLVRIRQAGIPLTICVDNVAASGGYMMACLGTKILCAPFAVLGSVGVVSSGPNFHRLLKKHDIDYEQVTAGEYKRTLTLFGENTEEGRQKYQDEINAIHNLFKGFVGQYRPGLDVDAIATGEAWFGTDAVERKLADEIKTSDEYLQEKVDSADLIQLQYHKPKKGGLKARLVGASVDIVELLFARLSKRPIGF